MNCIIVDDERPAIRLLESYVKKLPFLQLKAICESGIEALDILQKETIQLMLLDIQMPDLTGLELIKSLSVKPQVLLITAYPDYAVEGFELEVTDYLVKPVSFERFVKGVNRARELAQRPSEPWSKPKDHIFIKTDYKQVKVLFSEIVYIKGMGAYVDIRTQNGRYVIHQSMKKMEQQLPKGMFFRVHKSYLIALEKVTAVYGNLLEIGGQKIPIGKSYREAFMTLINTM